MVTGVSYYPIIVHTSYTLDSFGQSKPCETLNIVLLKQITQNILKTRENVTATSNLTHFMRAWVQRLRNCFGLPE